jgi:glycosyltransferase involved in cell wall biosynthesis
MVESHKRIGTWRRTVDGFIALNSFAKSKFMEGGLPPNRIAVKGNTIADPSVPDVVTARHGALFVGRLSEEKGLSTLLEAWKGLDYPLKIIGAGPLEKRIEGSADGNVKCIGYLSRDELYSEMRKASFLILPSLWYEMFPIVVIDSFACHLPVIASKLGGIEEINIDRVTGLNFRAGDSNHLAQKVRWAIAHPSEMQQYGKNARQKYEACYTPAINYQELMKIYQEVISRTKIDAGSSF